MCIEWKLQDGTYSPYSCKHNHQIQEAWQCFKGGGEKTFKMQINIPSDPSVPRSKSRERTATIDFERMTVLHEGGWTSRVRRWDVQDLGSGSDTYAASWDHQPGNGNMVPTTLDSDPVDYTMVESSFFRQRDDAVESIISSHKHQIVQVCRI